MNEDTTNIGNEGLLKMVQEWDLDRNKPIPPQVSEVLGRRDNYFHSCWMDLKRRRPDLWEEMTTCEMYIAGLLPADEDKDDDDERLTDTIL